jgi:hypothetical protein
MTNRTTRLFLRRLASGSLVASVCAIGFASTGQAQTLGPVVQVTGTDPFTSCTKDNVGQQETAFGSVLFPNTSIEPWVAVDPTDTSRLLVGHQQDRWSDGGARGDIDALSNDGGATWTNPIPPNPPGVTECTGGKAARASDPWVAFANDGTAFFMSLFLDPAKPTTPFGARKGGMDMSRSTDHGATWSAPVTLVANNSPHVLNDKNSVTADPTENGLVYAVWDQLSVFPPTDAGAALLAQNDGVAIARQLLHSAVGNSSVCAPFTKPPCKGGAPFFKFNVTGPTLLSLSTNNGVGFNPPATIVNTGTNQQTIDNLVQVIPNGNVYDFFTFLNLVTGAVNIEFVRSSNKGISWSAPPSVATDIQVVGVVSPDTGQALRDASILYSVSVNPVSGAIYLTWQDDRFSTTSCITPGTPSPGIPIDGIVFSQSLDGGAIWSKPVMINKTPANATNPCRQQAFIPAVVATGDGKTVVVTYYDFRNDTNTPAGFEGTDYFAIFCFTTTDCTNPANWVNEQRLTTTSFNILNAPVAGGHFLGDYMGLAASGPNTVYPVFGQATGVNTTADFTRSISGLP